MNKKRQVLGIFLTLFTTLTMSMLVNGNVFANLLPITPPITSPITPPSPTPTPTATPTSDYFLQIRYPNGGETFENGNSYTIQWDSSHNFTDISLYYVMNGQFSGGIATNIPDTGSFVWQVRPIYGNGQYKIAIFGNINGYNYANDNSDSYFTVIPSTSTPTATATATSTPMATPIPTATATPTAIPTVTPNSAPIIVTSSLPTARVGKFYSMTVVGYDLNTNNPLGLNVDGLPYTMTVSSCQTYINDGKKYVQCTYTGKPKRAATYKLNVSINDYAGGITKKNLTLKVVAQ